MNLLLAKEWIELLRSGAMIQIFLGFIGLISGIYFVVWLIETGIGILLPFNLVFYSGLAGLMGVMAYSWITNMESNECLNAMPVSIDNVAKAKIILNLLLTSLISTGFSIIIGVLKNETYLIPLGILVSIASSIYSVAITAYLTGLWTNTMFFDVRVLTKFSLAVVPLLTTIELASLTMLSKPFISILVVILISLMQMLISIPVLRRLKQKWAKMSFSYAINI
jgi:hypothetical protein